MYSAQLDAVYRLLHPVHPNHLAVIQQTGAGKTHILRMLGVIKRGITLIFILLLTLSANVMSKFTCANQNSVPLPCSVDSRNTIGTAKYTLDEYWSGN